MALPRASLGNTTHLRTVSNAALNYLRPHRIPAPSAPSSSSSSSPLTRTATASLQSRKITASARSSTESSSNNNNNNNNNNNTQFVRPISTTTPAKMSTMKATGGHSEACCNIPPIVSSGYAKKGDYETLDGRKTYVTGLDTEATRGILVIMDIFGFFDQTVQGCDILATADDHHKYAVFMPDAFDGAPLPIGLFPPDTEEKQKKVGEFFGKNSPPSFVPKAHAVVKAAQEKYPNIKEWGVVGFCWGSKVISLATSQPDNPYKIAAECHPAMVDPKDAEKIKIPLAMLASKDEPAEDVKKFEAALTGPKHVEIFADQIHGWMAARSDLTDKRVQEEYTRGYKTVLTFFANNWH